MATTPDILDAWALPPPSGVQRDFTNPANIYPESWVAGSICVVISTIAIVIRLYTKLFIAKKLGWEDYTAALGYLIWIVYLSCSAMVGKYGGGIHQWNIRVRDMVNVLYWVQTSSILYGVTVTIIKISILLQYMKLFVAVKREGLVYWGSQTLIWTTILFYTICTFLEIFSCSPREKYWKPYMSEGHCLDINAINIISAAFNSLSDFSILLLPQLSIWRLRMPAKQKVGISGAFAVGFFACVAATMRLYYSILLLLSRDFSYEIGRMGLWTWAEISVGIICSCVPALARWIKAISPRLAFFATSHARSRPELSMVGATRLNDSESDRQALAGVPTDGIHRQGSTSDRSIMRTIRIEMKEHRAFAGEPTRST